MHRHVALPKLLWIDKIMKTQDTAPNVMFTFSPLGVTTYVYTPKNNFATPTYKKRMCFDLYNLELLNSFYSYFSVLKGANYSSNYKCR